MDLRLNLRIELRTSHTEGRALPTALILPPQGTEGLTPHLATANGNASMNPDLKLNFQFTGKRSKFTVSGGSFLLSSRASWWRQVSFKYIFIQELNKDHNYIKSFSVFIPPSQCSINAQVHRFYIKLMAQGCQTPTPSNIENWWGREDRWRHNARHMTSFVKKYARKRCWWNYCNIWPNWFTSH